MFLSNRRFWNPMLVFSGCLTMASGALLVLHFQGHFLLVLHEWSGIVFVVSGAVHIFLNYRSLVKSLGNRPSTWGVIALLLLLLVAMTVSAIRGGRGEHKHNTLEKTGELGFERKIERRRPGSIAYDHGDKSTFLLSMPASRRH